MNVEIIKGQRVLTPDENMWLYNESHRVISDKVYLGVEADTNEWSEISEELKQTLETKWYDETTDGDASIDDYQSALAELGLSYESSVKRTLGQSS